MQLLRVRPYPLGSDAALQPGRELGQGAEFCAAMFPCLDEKISSDLCIVEDQSFQSFSYFGGVRKRAEISKLIQTCLTVLKLFPKFQFR